MHLSEIKGQFTKKLLICSKIFTEHLLYQLCTGILRALRNNKAFPNSSEPVEIDGFEQTEIKMLENLVYLQGSNGIRKIGGHAEAQVSSALREVCRHAAPGAQLGAQKVGCVLPADQRTEDTHACFLLPKIPIR